MGRVPPQNIDAEKSVLGAILLDNEAGMDVSEILQADDFYVQQHNDIFAAVNHLIERGEPADLVTLTNELKMRGNLDKIGGAAALAGLVEAVPTSANATYYAKIVKDKSMLRKVINAASQIATNGYEEATDVATFLDQAEKTIFQVSETQAANAVSPIAPVIKDAFIQIEKNYERKALITGLPSGFKSLDKITSGLQPSDLIIIAGRPAMGKTSLCMNIVEHVGMREKAPAVVFSLEMAKEQLVMRMLCSSARIDSAKVRTGMLNDEEWQRLTHIAGPMSESKIFIDDTPALSPFEIRARARRIKAQHGLGLIVIDYLQLMTLKGKNDSREREISEISRALKGMAKELNVPVIALSQLNRSVESRTDKRPQMSDLRESGAIEQDADIIGFIYRDEVYNKDNPENKGLAELSIAKHRNGPTGVAHLAFVSEFTRFENLAQEYAPAE